MLQSIEEYILRVVNTVDHEARTAIVTGVLDKFYSYISDPRKFIFLLFFRTLKSFLCLCFLALYLFRIGSRRGDIDRACCVGYDERRNPDAHCALDGPAGGGEWPGWRWPALLAFMPVRLAQREPSRLARHTCAWRLGDGIHQSYGGKPFTNF